MAFNIRLQLWSLTALGNGIKILLIKDHIHSSINVFCERIRAINASFAVGYLKNEQSMVLQFSENHCTCVFYIL